MSKNRNWILAIVTAVAFPALVLHSTCVAVLGPGTWGAGVEEHLPAMAAPTSEAERYRDALRPVESPVAPGQHATAVPGVDEVEGSVVWTHSLDNRSVVLTRSAPGASPPQRLYASLPGQGLREVPIAGGHFIARPQWTSDGLVYVRWNPWAIPPMAKLRRYVASWFDPSTRPEAAVYGCPDASGDWQFLMPGHTITVSPDGDWAALLRSGAQLAGYYSIHLWRVGEAGAETVLSLREYQDHGTDSFRLRWTEDSAAVVIQGRTSGFLRRGSRDGPEDGIRLDLVYDVSDGILYDYNLPVHGEGR